MPKRLNLTDEQRKERKREYQRRYRQKLKAEKEKKRQEQAKAKATLLDSLPDPTIPDAITAAIVNERHGFSIIEGVQHGEKRIVILESLGNTEIRYRVKEVSYSFFPTKTEAVEYCRKNAKRMKYFFLTE